MPARPPRPAYPHIPRVGEEGGRYPSGEGVSRPFFEGAGMVSRAEGEGRATEKRRAQPGHAGAGQACLRTPPTMDSRIRRSSHPEGGEEECGVSLVGRTPAGFQKGDNGAAVFRATQKEKRCQAKIQPREDVPEGRRGDDHLSRKQHQQGDGLCE